MNKKNFIIAVDKNLPIPRHYQARQKLKEMLMLPEYQKGDKIPSERELSLVLDISRLTVRKAISNLVAENILVQEWGKGTFLRKKPKITTTSKTGNIAITVWNDKGTLSHPATAEFIRGAGEILSNSNYNSIFLFINKEVLKKDRISELITNSNLVGIIIQVQELQKRHIKLIAEKGIFIVLINHNFPDITSCLIFSGNFHNISLASKHLINLNHKRIGLINGPNSFHGSQETLQGYEYTLEKHGLEFKKELVKNGYYDRETGAKLMGELLSLPEKPTAIIAADDMMAAGAMQKIKEKGLKIPEDISLIGGNDMPLASLLNPPLTTIKISHYRSGQLSAQMLLKLINNEKIEKPQVVLKGRLIIRGSCGPYLKKKNVRKGARKNG